MYIREKKKINELQKAVLRSSRYREKEGAKEKKRYRSECKCAHEEGRKEKYKCPAAFF
jgi:hypothetical protein